MVLFLDIADATRMFDELLRAHWPVVLTAALGCAAIWGLLPRSPRAKPVWAGLAAALALLVAAVWLVWIEGAWQERFLFGCFAVLAVAGAALMLAQSNPVHAALSFALVVLSTCGLFLLLHAPFLMAATIIIYAGAIIVTFLFVLMLAQQAGLASADARSREPFLASLAGFVLLGSLGIVLDRTYNAEPHVRQLFQAARAQSFEEIAALWGDPGPDAAASNSPQLFHDLKARGFPEQSVSNLDFAWVRRDLAGVKKHAQALFFHAQESRQRRGMLTTPGREPAKQPALPARNVAALGRSLFTEHLVAVEMAGVLLLVATIGAIAIAGRRADKVSRTEASRTEAASRTP
jgi:NADH:ubiquinone oxidoreductase subunit 6 (subunit J)